MYVIMKECQSPIFYFSPKPHEVVLKLADAKTRVRELNEKATTNHYWYVKVPLYEKRGQ